MKWRGSMVKHVKSFFVIEFRRYFIFKFSTLGMSHASIWYLKTCLTIDSFVSLENLVNLGTFYPLQSSVCWTYSDRGDTKLGLWRPMLRPFWIGICSTTFVMLFSPLKLFCWTFLSIWSASWFLLTIIGLGLFWPMYSSSFICMRGLVCRSPPYCYPWFKGAYLLSCVSTCL